MGGGGVPEPDNLITFNLQPLSPSSPSNLARRQRSCFHPLIPESMKYTYAELAKMIDHSLLHPTLTDRELAEGCAIAAQYQVASVCVKPCHIQRAADLLRGDSVLVGAVV